MSAKKPLVLDVAGEHQQLQTGDFIDVPQGGTGATTPAGALTALGAASSAALTAEVNRATSAESTLTTAAAAAQTTASAAVPQTTTVNGHLLNTNVVVNATDVGLGNVNNTSDANKPVSTAQAAADAATLASAQTYADGLVVGLWNDRGTFNASTNAFPNSGGSGVSGAIRKGDIWTIGQLATAGPLLGMPVGSTVRAVVAAPGQTITNWAIAEVGLGYVPYNATNPAGYISSNQNISVSGDATGSGANAISLTLANTAVTPGVFGDASHIPTVTVDSKGRITGISISAVSIVSNLAGLSDVTLTAPAANDVLQYIGGKWINAPLAGGGSGGAIAATSLTVASGIIENAATVPNDYTIAPGNNAFSAGPITIATGKKVNVSNGSVWVIG